MTGGRVTRSGSSLSLNGHPYRFVGINIWRAAVTSWNQNPATGYDVNDGTTLADSITSINSPTRNCNVIRFWCFQEMALRSASVTPVPAGTAWDFSAIEKVLTVADAANMKVIAALIAEWSWSGPAYLDTPWWTSGYSSTVLPYHLVDYRTWVSMVTSRYAGDNRILFWELVNEGDVSGGGTCPGNAGTLSSNFCTDIAGLIKGYDSGALISPGMAGEVCGWNGADYSTIAGLSNIDLMSFHDYTGTTNQGGTWAGNNGLDDCTSRAHTAGKPVYVGETGLHLNDANSNGDRAVRSSFLRAKMDLAFNNYGVAGYLPWHWDSRSYSDDYNYSLSDPGLRVLGTYLNG